MPVEFVAFSKNSALVDLLYKGTREKTLQNLRLQLLYAQHGCCQGCRSCVRIEVCKRVCVCKCVCVFKCASVCAYLSVQVCVRSMAVAKAAAPVCVFKCASVCAFLSVYVCVRI